MGANENVYFAPCLHPTAKRILEELADFWRLEPRLSECIACSFPVPYMFHIQLRFRVKIRIKKIKIIMLKGHDCVCPNTDWMK